MDRELVPTPPRNGSQRDGTTRFAVWKACLAGLVTLPMLQVEVLLRQKLSGDKKILKNKQKSTIDSTPKEKELPQQNVV